MSSKGRLDIASHSISLITIDFYRVWIIQIFFLIQIFVTDIKIELSGLHCSTSSITNQNNTAITASGF